MSEPERFELVARHLRAGSGGLGACDCLSLEAAGSKVVLAGGAADAVFAVLANQAQVIAGSLMVQGRDVAKREHLGFVGAAPSALPLPGDQTVLSYLELAFSLHGLSNREARGLAKAVLTDLRMEALASRRIGLLGIPERRAISIAQAMIPGGRIVAAQAPTAGLEGVGLQNVMAVLGAVAERRGVLVTVARVDSASNERELMVGADHVVVLAGEHVVWQGPPEGLLGDARWVSVVVRGNAEAFAARLKDKGIECRGQSPRWSVSLPQGVGATALQEEADAVGALIVEVIPVVGEG